MCLRTTVLLSLGALQQEVDMSRLDRGKKKRRRCPFIRLGSGLCRCFEVLLTGSDQVKTRNFEMLLFEVCYHLDKSRKIPF